MITPDLPRGVVRGPSVTGVSGVPLSTPTTSRCPAGSPSADSSEVDAAMQRSSLNSTAPARVASGAPRLCESIDHRRADRSFFGALIALERLLPRTCVHRVGLMAESAGRPRPLTARGFWDEVVGRRQRDRSHTPTENLRQRSLYQDMKGDRCDTTNACDRHSSHPGGPVQMRSQVDDGQLMNEVEGEGSFSREDQTTIPQNSRDLPQ